jgi:hypothetical protein
MPSISSRLIANMGERWPREMRAETAAAYCDEPSVNAFLKKVNRGLYSQPARQKGCLPKWHRAKLDRDIARRHGLRVDESELSEDGTELRHCVCPRCTNGLKWPRKAVSRVTGHVSRNGTVNWHGCSRKSCAAPNRANFRLSSLQDLSW